MSATGPVAALEVVEPYDIARVHDPLLGDGLLRTFNEVGVLVPADVHIARRLAAIGGDSDELVHLAVALAVRAPRVGHVSVDLTTVRTVAAADARDDIDMAALPWPEPADWLERVAASPLVSLDPVSLNPVSLDPVSLDPVSLDPVSLDPVSPDDRPLHLVGSALYLDRYWRDELAVAGDLRARAGATPPSVDAGVLAASVARLFGQDTDGDQRHAAQTAAARYFTVIAGGPGTGKTTTVARLLCICHELAERAGQRPPLVALAAPTGKAAARLEEAVRAEAARLPISDVVRDRLLATSGSTLHRLLGSRAGTARFRHHRGHRLPHDLIVVDEASMISLGLMARLVEAARPDARLILVGDPEQLVSVEAGAILADIVGPVNALPPAGASPMAASIALLHTNHRFGGALADLAEAVRAGAAQATLDILRSADPAVGWVPHEAQGNPAVLRNEIVGWATQVLDAARHSDAPQALAALHQHRVLCAHRRGEAGVTAWNDQIERWLAEDRPDLATEGTWYAGRPVLMTSNDYVLRLFNGDTGVTMAGGDEAASRVFVAFDDSSGQPRRVSPSRLGGVETVYAMTVHKSQGSEFNRVTLLLPPASSRLLTRELLYTAVTRAKRSLLVVGTEEAVRAAVNRPIARASGLTERLWRD